MLPRNQMAVSRWRQAKYGLVRALIKDFKITASTSIAVHAAWFCTFSSAKKFDG
jgi:hypothetical protein